MIKITEIRFEAEEEQEVLSVLRSGNIAQGNVVASLETQFARLTNVTNAIAVNNGTTALSLALESMGIGPGDEVITSPFTFVATVNAILERGATVKFADISDQDFAITPQTIEAVISNSTTLIMPVHLFGQMADMSGISKIAQARNIRILEDASQAHFASREGHLAGSLDVGTFSLYATKNITSGEGGVITTSNADVANAARILRNQGMRSKYEYIMPGHNYRLTDLQAALVGPQIHRYDENVKVRTQNAAYYQRRLSKIPGLKVPKTMAGSRHVWHQYTLCVEEKFGLSRDLLSEKLLELGIQSGIYYPQLLSDYEMFQNHPLIAKSDTPVAKKISGQVLSIPVHKHLSENDLDYICTQLENLSQMGTS